MHRSVLTTAHALCRRRAGGGAYAAADATAAGRGAAGGSQEGSLGCGIASCHHLALQHSSILEVGLGHASAVAPGERRVIGLVHRPDWPAPTWEHSRILFAGASLSGAQGGVKPC